MSETTQHFVRRGLHNALIMLSAVTGGLLTGAGLGFLIWSIA